MMKKVATTIEVHHFVCCPACGEDSHRVDHLFEDANTHGSCDFGPWYCSECGAAFRGQVVGTDVFTELIPEKRKDRSLVLLKYNNLLLMVEGMYFDGKLDKENDRYFYEEHTCPVNFMHNVEAVVDLESNEPDPHGMFEYIGTMPFADVDEEGVLQQLISLATKE